MSFFASSSYKPQIRQEGFHLPSPSSPTAPNHPPTPPPTSTTQFDSASNTNLFMPQNFLPEAFRRSTDTGPGSSSMDFGDELASLIANSPGPTGQHHGHNQHHQSSHERSTHSPHPSGDTSFDDGYRPTHNIFDISAPQQHHHQHSSSAGFPAHFSLPPSSHRPSDNIGLGSQPSSLHNPASSLHHQHHSIHDFNATPHSNFNSTLPALNSSMRFDPHPPGPVHTDVAPPSSFNYPAGVSQADYRGHNRHTPSPIGTSRSRSRSRAPSIGPTRNTTRARRNGSISSTSPPPMPGRPSAIVIPGAHRQINGNGNGVPVSPLSLHSLSSSTSGWFMPPHGQHSTNEYNLPTPESITNPFGPSFAASHQPQNMGISPSDVTSLSSLKDRHSSSSLKEEKHSNGDPVSKQALLANEKRRRRRESHNAVERRRRDNINEKISELATLIPECMLDPTAPVASPTATDDLFNSANAASPDSSSATQAKKEIPDDPTTPIEAGVVKANKGMILRKSVEYIRYLQQLVNAQANRNRELEQALSVYRHDDGDEDKSVMSSGLVLGLGMNGHGSDDNEHEAAQMHTPTSNDSPRPSGNGAVPNGHDDMGGLMLHEEVGGDGFGMNNLNFHMGFSNIPQGKGFHGFELASMPEDAEMDDRPTTAVTMSGTSPSVGSGEDNEEGRTEEEEERGRRGRDGRVRNGIQKYEEAEESSSDSRERREAPKAMET